jgi:hypothetical protein
MAISFAASSARSLPRKKLAALVGGGAPGACGCYVRTVAEFAIVLRGAPVAVLDFMVP